MKLKLRYLSANVLKSLILIIDVSFFVFGIGLFNAALASGDYSMVSTTSGAPKSPYILKFKKTLNCVLRTDIQSFSDTASKDLNHGSGTNFVGVMYEHLLKGPESFCIDSKGSVYICDTANKRIIIFNHDRNSSRSFELDNTPDDVTIDDSGNLYIYDDEQEKLFQYNNDNLIGTVDVRLPGSLPRGLIHVVNNTVYMVYGDQEDLLIGVIENGVLKPSSNLEAAPIKGIVGLSGKRYFINVTRDEKADVDIYDIAKNAEPNKVSILFNGVLDANFLGEDELGNFYIQTESHGEKGSPILLDVIKCNPQGKVLNILNLSSKGYRLESIKMTSWTATFWLDSLTKS
jgi:hypothetical protein